jgi:nucleoside-diphosphate-sugar epimerase
MRILVIGGTAFTGPHVVRRLHELGHELLLYHRGQTEAGLPPAVRHVYGDRQQWDDFAGELRRFSPQLVLDSIPFRAQHAWDVVCAFRGIAGRVVALSSQDVYRAYGTLIGLEPGPLETVPVDEDAPLRSRLYPYRERAEDPDQFTFHYEKILVERLYRSEPGLPATILRLPMIYGPRDRQHRTYEYLKRMDDGRPAILLAERMARWRWTKGYVEDVARAVVLAVTDDRASGRVYNVGEPEALAERAWVEAIARAAGWTGRIVLVPGERATGALDPGTNVEQHLVTDTARIRRELGYSEQVPRQVALQRTIAWERANPPELVDPARFDYAAEDALLAELE